MARNRLDTPAPDLAEINHDALADVAQAQTALSVRTQQINELYGDGLPYERESVVAELRMHLDHSAQAMLEAGKRLILLKENEPAGEFHACLERVGVNVRTAQRLMQAAVKYTQRLPEAKAEKLVALGRTKLLELMVIDDGELEALADGGTVAGLVLDEVERMSTSELREALREARANDDAKQRLLSEKNTKIDELAAKLTTKPRAIEPATPDQEGADLRREVSLWAFDAETAIRGNLARGFEALLAHTEKCGATHEEYMSGCLAQIERALLEVREHYGIKRAPTGDNVPAWAHQSAEELDAMADAALAGITGSVN